jgi:hypothetical protein
MELSFFWRDLKDRPGRRRRASRIERLAFSAERIDSISSGVQRRPFISVEPPGRGSEPPA